MQQADQPGESTQPTKRIFISYGRQDATHVAVWLHQELVALGYDVWLDQHDLQQATGAEWERKIEDAIRQRDVVIALMSPHSVRPQSECRNEISLAKDSDLAIVPVMVNRCDRPLRLHALQYIDLAGFERLSQQARAILLNKVIDAIEHGVSEDPLLASLREKFAPLDFDWMFSRHEKFVGREWLFDQFDKWLQDNSEPVLFLVGPPGIGKSAALSKWIQMRMKIGAVHFCRHDRADLRDPVVMVKSIVTQLLQVQNQLPGFAESISSINLGSSDKAMDSTDRAAELMDTMVLDPLRKIQPGQCWVLVIDALDEGGEGIQNLLAKVQGHLPPTVKMIVSARPEADVLTLFPNKVVLNALGAENQADLVKYVQQRMDLSNRFAASDEIEKQHIVDGVVAWSEGVFLVAVLVLDEIEAGRLEINNLNDPIGGLAGFYLQHFRRLFANEEKYQDVADCLEVMLVSHEPLSDQFIADVLDRPVRNVTRALNQLGSLVPVQQGTRSPFHKSLFDWLRASQEIPHTYALPVGGGLVRIEKWCERMGTVEASNFMGEIYCTKPFRKLDKACAKYEKSLEIARNIVINLKTLESYEILCATLNNVASIKQALRELDSANKHYEECLAIRRDLAKKYCTSEHHRNVCVSLDNVAGIQEARNNLDSAYENYNESLKIRRKLMAEVNSYDTSREVLKSLGHIADIMSKIGNLDVAVKTLTECVEISRNISFRFRSAESERVLSIFLDRVGAAYYGLKEWDLAHRHYEESLKITERIALELGTLEGRRDITVTIESIAQVEFARQHDELALEHHGKSLQIREGIANEERDSSKFLYRLADIARSRGWISKILLKSDPKAALENILKAHQASEDLSTIEISEKYYLETAANIWEVTATCLQLVNRQNDSDAVSKKAENVRRRIAMNDL